MTTKQENVELEEVKTTGGGTETNDVEPESKHMTVPSDENDFESLTNDVSFATKIYLLTWKNFKSQVQRRKGACAFKILFPAIIMCIIGAIRTLPDIIDVNCNKLPDGSCSEFYYSSVIPAWISPLTTSPINVNMEAFPEPYNEPFTWLGNILCLPEFNGAPNPERNPTQPAMYIGIVTNPDTVDQTRLQGLLDILNDTFIFSGDMTPNDDDPELFNVTERDCRESLLFSQFINFSEGSALKFFDTNEELNAYVGDKKYAGPGFNLANTNKDTGLRPIGAAIIINSISDDGLVWNYTLRFNQSNVPDTNDNNVNRFERDSEVLLFQGGYYEYVTFGFVQMQNWIDQGIARYIAALKTMQYNAFVHDTTKGVMPFPFTTYKKDTFWEIISGFFFFLIFVMFCYPVLQVLSLLISEKADKIKEGLLMMGGTTTTFWTSWILWFFMEFTLIAIIVTLLGTAFSVFSYSNPFIIFLWFWLFCLSQMAFFLFLSAFFSNAKTASLVGFILLFVLMAFSSFMDNMEIQQKRNFCILAAPCFVHSVNTLTTYESALIGVQFDNIGDIVDEFSFNIVLRAMFLDTILFLLLGLYFDRVWPSRFGQRLKPWFCCLPSFWGCKSKDLSTINSNLNPLGPRENYEEINLKAKPTITVRGLKKSFKTGILPKSKVVNAVRGIDIDMYGGQVFCLLGHNGAGKSTTIGMLSGLLESTEGDAVILGNSIANDMPAIRKSLGVCPQHDVLFPKLTSEEHLWLYGRLKGIDKDRVQREIESTLETTELNKNGLRTKYPKDMSGGEKRKLSLAIALIGGSKVVFLDEPSSGMDPQSRRITWNIIQKEKKKGNRTIILTTHYMDEADVLGDRIGIMSNGKIVCCGTSLYLKSLYGVGYTMTISLKPGSDDVALKPDIDAIVFSKIDGAGNLTSAGGELNYRLPLTESSKFPQLFKELDTQSEQLSISNYGIGVTTLEEVFLKIGHDEEEQKAKEENELLDKKAGIIVTNNTTQPIDEEKGRTNDANDEMKELKDNTSNNKDGNPDVFKFNQSSFKLEDRNEVWILFQHIYAILYKRFHWSRRDFKALICQLICPVWLGAISLGLITIQITSDQPNLVLSTDAYYPANENLIPYTNASSTLNPITNFYTDMDWIIKYNDLLSNIYGDLYPFTINNSSSPFPGFDPMTNQTIPVTYTMNFQREMWEESGNYPNDVIPYVGFYVEPYTPYNGLIPLPFDIESVMIGANASGIHSLPIAMNIWNNWQIKRWFDDDAQIYVNTEPLPPTESEQSLSAQISGFISAIYLVLAFSFIPATAIYFIVNERKTNSKHQQLVSGISLLAYWIANYIADIFVALPAAILVFLCVFIFDVEPFKGQAAGPFFVTILMFIFSSLPFTYLLHFLFKSPSKAQYLTILLYVLLGMILGIVSWVLDLTPSTENANKSLKPIYRFFPTFTLSENLLALSFKEFLYGDKGFWDWELVSRNVIWMLLMGFGYFGLVLIIEYLGTFPLVLSKLGLMVNEPKEDIELDDDVIKEQNRIKEAFNEETQSIDSSKLTDTVVLCGLRKVYKSPRKDVPNNIAVRDLWYGVKQGEVFGFLGVNGAGKTSTLAMLTGERYPSSGTAFINGFPISDQLSCRRVVGYTPQFDTIFELLTAKEHLNFYAMLKGLNGKERSDQVEILLSALTLQKYRNRKAGTYSGGNKRKLSVAVAMIGNPKVVFLDEPSTGMDPVSRRSMWKFIQNTMKGRCVILTTHSMEECQALCYRLGIQVDGQLKCIGTPQELKSKFGKGYQLEITLKTQTKVNINDSINQVNILLKEHFNTKIIEQNIHRLTMELTNKNNANLNNDNNKKLYQIFEIIEDIKNKTPIVSYAISQTTLEQIFISMAKDGEKNKNDTNNNGQTKTMDGTNDFQE